MNSFQKQFGDITLMEFTQRKEEFKELYERLWLPPYRSTPAVKEFKTFIYSLEMAEYKKDKMWEYLNEDITGDQLEHFTNGVYSGWFKTKGFDKSK